MDAEILSCPSLERRVMRGYAFSLAEPLINQRMLYNKHLGLKKPVEQLLTEKDEKALKLKAQVEHALRMARGCAELDCVYAFLPAEPQGDSIAVYSAENAAAPSESFSFPRQSSGEKLCLADFVARPAGGKRDSVGLFVCTAGAGILRRAAELREQGEYVSSHMLNIIAICLAEALAEAVHAELRRSWGLPDKGHGSPEDFFRKNYAGARFSFGYPACPGLENQAALFRLLRPEEIGVSLTEGFMMAPEASVSALVFHYQGARYFEII